MSESVTHYTTLYCEWCPDTRAVWSRWLDDHVCPDCRGCDFVEREDGDE